ncbi:c-type cytochrome [Aurantimonas marianensis]|uniref:Cytochrome c n=1 Tax=Aurantimonas marianensis TaxID=2920428 RepID=A0A9X2H4P5_9HYPH|nr:cytochrome c [Aurantimonas marianensis]MCP3055575.1 cytochrome c [Aurantimonas marianensis]
MKNRALILTTVLVATALAIWWRLDGRGGDGAGAGVALAEVVVPELTAEESRGETLFNANCATCHGANAAGRSGKAPPLVHNIYEPNHHADAAFQLAVQNGVRDHHWGFGNMPPIEGVSPKNVSQIAAYVRALQRANGIQ